MNYKKEKGAVEWGRNREGGCGRMGEGKGADCIR